METISFASDLRIHIFDAGANEAMGSSLMHTALIFTGLGQKLEFLTQIVKRKIRSKSTSYIK
jgi:hypothetical protein